MTTGFIKGDSSEAKFASIERALQRLSRKSVKKVGIEVPPIPISKFQKTLDEDGVIQRYMFPASGQVEKAIIFVETFPDEIKRIPLHLDIATFEGTEQKNLTITPTLNTFNVNMPVTVGARFTLSLVDPSIALSGIWASFLYRINIKHNRLQELAAEEMVNLSLEYQNERV